MDEFETEDSFAQVVSGHLITVLAVSIGTVSGFALSVILVLAFVSILLGLGVWQHLGTSAGNVIHVIGVPVAAILIAWISSLLSRFLLRGWPRKTGHPFPKAPETAWWVKWICGVGVIVVYPAAFLVFPAGGWDLVARPWTWPIWMVGAAVISRWAALTSKKGPNIERRVAQRPYN